MVALGDYGKPVPLPRLEPETSDEHRRHREANHRRERRLALPAELRDADS